MTDKLSTQTTSASFGAALITYCRSLEMCVTDKQSTKTTEEDCGRCFNSGWIVIRASTLAYVCPGSYPDDVPGLSGTPLAAGWFVGFLIFGIWIARHSYNHESITLAAIAFLAFIAAIPGSFVLLFWMNGLP